ncbi:MAG: hypothetical protein ACC742_10440 [Thermoanaerobaculales bacterium]
MRNRDWTQYLVAAIIVLLAGAFWALAEEVEMKVQVRNHGGQEISIDVNGVKETIQLEDLAEGEERSFDVGGRPIVVRRVQDSLTLIHEGLMEGGEGGAFFVGDEGAEGHRVIVIKKGEGGEDCDINIEELEERFGDELQTIEIKGAPHRMAWHSAKGNCGTYIINSGEQVQGTDFVHYRCEATGSMLTVKKDENLLDDYVDPVTGWLMKKVDGPNVRVITILHEIKEEGEDTDD